MSAILHVKSNTIGDMTGTVTVYNSAGSTATVAATNLVRPLDWNSGHNQSYTLSGTTAISSSGSGTNIIYSAAGAGMTLQASSNTIIFSTPPHISSFMNQMLWGASTSASLVGSGSVSHCVAFNLPEPISASFLRLPVSFTTNSTTLATTAQAATNLSAELYSTWNAVVYSMGTGASSRSLISVASGSGGFTFRNSVSISATTQYSVTLGFSAQVQGGGTTRTTQYSISNTNISLTSNQIATEWSGLRFLDIPFANSLSAGPYWLVFGYKSSSATNNASASNFTQNNVRYSYHLVASQHNLAFGIMGSTNFTSGGLMGIGSFSTAGGGTTSGFPISAISSSASHNVPHFQLLRSA